MKDAKRNTKTMLYNLIAAGGDNTDALNKLKNSFESGKVREELLGAYIKDIVGFEVYSKGLRY